MAFGLTEQLQNSFVRWDTIDPTRCFPQIVSPSSWQPRRWRNRPLKFPGDGKFRAIRNQGGEGYPPELLWWAQAAPIGHRSRSRWWPRWRTASDKGVRRKAATNSNREQDVCRDGVWKCGSPWSTAQRIEPRKDRRRRGLREFAELAHELATWWKMETHSLIRWAVVWLKNTFF